MNFNTYRHISISLVCLAAMIFLWGCGGSKPSVAKKDNPYARKPLVEVSENQLQLDAMLIEARMQQEVGNLEMAEQGYRNILSKDPGYGGALYEMSCLMMSRGRLDSASAYIDRAIQVCDSNIWYHMQRVQCLTYMGQKGRVCEEWETIVKLKPSQLEYYYHLSDAYLLANNASKAIESLNRIENMVGVTEEVSLQKQRIWNSIGKADKGIKEIEALANVMPQEKKYNAILAESYMKTKNYPKAKLYYERALAADPSDDYLHLSAASYYKVVGDHERASQELRIGFAGSSMDVASKMKILVNFYTKEEFYGDCSRYAFPLVDMLMAQATDSTSLAIFYGDILMRQEKYAEAVRQFELHLGMDSSSFDVWEALLVCDMQQEPVPVKQTMDHALRANALFPLLPLPYYILGEIARREGRFEECYKHYDRCLDLRPDDPMILNSYAYTLGERNERLNEALEMGRKAVELDPENPHVLDTYAWLLHLVGRNEEALPIMKKAVRLDKENNEILRDHLKAIER